MANFVCKLEVQIATGGTMFCVKAGPNLFFEICQVNKFVKKKKINKKKV